MNASGIVGAITRANPLTLAALAVGAWVAYRVVTSSKPLGQQLVEDAGTAAFEVAKAAGAPVIEMAADIQLAAQNQQQKEFLLSVKVLGGVVPWSPVEEGIALSYMPALQLLDGLPLFSQWAGVKAVMAARAIHEYRQAIGLEPRPIAVTPTPKPDFGGSTGTGDYGPWWLK